MKISFISTDGKEIEYDNINYICNVVRFDLESKKPVFYVRFGNAVDRTFVELENIKSFEIFDGGARWINIDGRRICPKCGERYPKSFKKPMKFCPSCGLRIL